jgi:peptide/nickel transport system permease protein
MAVDLTVPSSPVSTQEVAGRSLRQLAWARFRKDKAAMVSLGVLAFIFLIALCAPLICSWMGVDPYTFNPELISDDGGKPYGAWGGMSWQHPFGVEWGTGRDIFARLLYGMRISLLISIVATCITVALGTFFGIVSGYVGGKTDAILGRFMDLILAFPFLLIVLALSGTLTQRITALGVPEGNASRLLYLILIFSLFGWPYLARIIRGQVLSLREREFVESAAAMGASGRRILFKEILPNLWAPILVSASLTLPTYIGAEAALSFLGVGILPPEPSFGAILADSVNYFKLVPSYLFIPGGILAIIVITFNLVGDGVRDALDPRAARS